MQITAIPFSITDWAEIEATVHEGVTGEALWKTMYINEIRVRLVEYTAGYVADHWCSKGHIIFCVDGEMETQLYDGRTFTLKKGMTYTVGDNEEAHKSSTTNGCILFIVD
jgi:quercetin dioxygenase-like cupin family protein